MQSLIGSYLQFSVDAFCHDKKAFLAQPYGKGFDFIEEYSRLNMKLFNRTVTAFLRLPRHDDVTPTLRTNLTKLCEAIDGFIQLAQEAKAELGTSFQSSTITGPDLHDDREIATTDQ
jgi:polyhydroxyalkanoate synthesis regulator protein